MPTTSSNPPENMTEAEFLIENPLLSPSGFTCWNIIVTCDTGVKSRDKQMDKRAMSNAGSVQGHHQQQHYTQLHLSTNQYTHVWTHYTGTL